jgi:uncharacterized protein (DUF885 family)
MQRAWFMVMLLLTGCSVPQPHSDGRAGDADAALAKLIDEYLKGYLAWRPALAVRLGLHQYDGRITDLSPASLQAERRRLKDFETRLASLPTNLLSREAAWDQQILLTSIRNELFEFDVLQHYNRNPMTYVRALDLDIYIRRNFAPLEQRVRTIIAILDQASNLMAAARANLAQALPRPYVETAIQMAEGQIQFLKTDLVQALEPCTNVSLRAAFDRAQGQAVAALEGFVAYLKETALPVAHEQFALGRDNFARMLREGELIHWPPEQILDIGLRELAREQQAFAEAARRIDPTRPPIEVFRAIQKEHPTEQSLLADTRRNLEAIRQFVVQRRIVTIPSEVRPRVEETPPFERATSFASMDTPGPFETQATEAYYYVTPPDPAWTPEQKAQWLTAFNYYTTDIVSIHEAYPGHYVQALCLNASKVSPLRKIIKSYAFEEGWAHYTEQMMLEQGFGTDPSTGQADPIRAAKYRLAQADEALLRLCRLCVAIRMHCQGMTVAEATRFFMDNCYYEEKPARQEAIRGTFDPGYLYYTLGKLMILKLREDWRQQEGPAFSLQRFHDELLRHGQPPLPLLRQMMLNDPKLWDQLL